MFHNIYLLEDEISSITGLLNLKKKDPRKLIVFRLHVLLKNQGIFNTK